MIDAYHNWAKMGIFNVRVKAKDHNGAESEWSNPQLIIVPKSKMNYHFDILFEKFLQRFPFLSKILNL